MDTIIDAILGIPGFIVRLFMQLAITIIGFILDIIFTLIGDLTLPQFATYSQYITNFWDLCFQFIGYIRSIFLIDTFSMNIIMLMLIIRFTYKPTISIVKMFITWYSKLH